MQLVEVKGISKRRKKPIVLTVEQYCLILALIPERYRTMAVVAQCTGLRAEEVLALEWKDIDFEHLSMKVVRAVVHGRVKMVKTEYSEDELPLDPDFAAILLDWKLQSRESVEKAPDDGKTPYMGLDLIFPSSKRFVRRRELNPVPDGEFMGHFPVDADAGQAAGIIGEDITGSMFDGHQIHCGVCTDDRCVCSGVDARLLAPSRIPYDITDFVSTRPSALGTRHLLALN